MTDLGFVYDDGGRSQAGFKGDTGDCVIRSIAIASGVPYQEVYDALHDCAREYAATRRNRVARRLQEKGGSPRNGTFREVYEPYVLGLGFTWTPTMSVGSGCKVHLRADELPEGSIICAVSKHLCAVVDGVVRDTWDPRRNGSRCVYGWYGKE